MPTKTSYEYKSANSPDLAGLSLSATYKDGTTETITDISKMNISGFTTSSVGSKNINVEYGGKTATFSIEVSYAWWQILIRIFLLGFLWY
ncbi:MAG: bacterial Ig-like domain-containing protein [Clostridia bacterium]|nr:bacterial Ig-like domain-containing protein [Clostridia bacterium]